jgi:cell division protein FtsL
MNKQDSRRWILRGLVVFLAVISIPLFLCLTVWQSTRYQNLKKELTRLERAQGEWVESNKRLIADIVTLSSQRRIEDIAENSLFLHRIRPENVLQIRITEGARREL